MTPDAFGMKGATHKFFEDARKTNRLHQITVQINNALMAFTLLCMTLSLVAKEIEIDLMTESSLG